MLLRKAPRFQSDNPLAVIIDSLIEIVHFRRTFCHVLINDRESGFDLAQFTTQPPRRASDRQAQGSYPDQNFRCHRCSFVIVVRLTKRAAHTLPAE